MSLSNQFIINFWGVRGSIPCPGPETVRYGGNTPCVEMIVGGERLIFDGGTGLRVLGKSLLSQLPVSGHLFFTHFHWDHIQGFPFFTPAFIKNNRFKIYGVANPDEDTIEERLRQQMLHPNFPVPLQVMQADLEFLNLEVGQTLNIDQIQIENAQLNHPGQAFGYRVSWRGLSVAYITDTEHYPDGLDQNVLHLARGVNVLIIDATYTDEEYNHPQTSKKGWGHSTWQEAVKIAQAAEVEQLVIFHHDPSHDDYTLDRIGANAARAFPGTVMAYEGQTITLVPQKMPVLSNAEPF